MYSTSFEQKTTDLIISQPLDVYVGDPWYETGTGFMVKNFYFEKVWYYVSLKKELGNKLMNI